MDIKVQRENRLHGNPQFPLAVYLQERKAFEPILDNHWHEEAEFLWIVSGQAIFQIGLATFELHAGEGIYIPCGEVHGGYSLENSPCTYVAMVFHLDWLTEAKDGAALRFLQPIQRGEAVIPSKYTEATIWGELVMQRLSRINQFYEADDAAREMKIKAELYLLFADLISNEQWTLRDPSSSVDTLTIDRLKGAVAYIEENCGQPITVGQLAEAARMSTGHFSRIFKSFMRKTPMEYVNHYRIQQAAYLLQNVNITVAEAAMEVGLTNFSYFSKKFKSIYDCTPSDFRKKLRCL
ncbi:helix-turn-helix domain-containing protein [Cohnella sp.]|uniref:AraC family transcriptional regulator n=1 Tax=Cohnella sp. TaxID=1883426 RepID=UPI003566E0FC